MISVKCQEFPIFVIRIAGKKERTLEKKKMLVYGNDNKLLYNYVVCDMAHPKAYTAREQKGQNFPLVSTRETGYYNVI